MWFLGFLLCARQDARDGEASLSCLALLLLSGVVSGLTLPESGGNFNVLVKFLPAFVFASLVYHGLAGPADLLVVIALALRYSVSCSSAIIAVAACSAMLSSTIASTRGQLPFIPHLLLGDVLFALWCWDCFSLFL
jgi:hypothetical protein